MKKHKAFAKQHCDSLKLEKGCAICGYNALAGAMDFHHIKGLKVANIARLHGQAMFEEMKKCIILCCRCHREVHAGVHSLKPLYRKVVTEEDIGFMVREWEKVWPALARERAVDGARADFSRFRSGTDRRRVAMKLISRG